MFAGFPRRRAKHSVLQTAMRGNERRFLRAHPQTPLTPAEAGVQSRLVSASLFMALDSRVGVRSTPFFKRLCPAMTV
jgi:hypothetical protein